VDDADAAASGPARLVVVRIEVATGAMAAARDGVRSGGARLRRLEVRSAGSCDSGDLAADDAVRALLDVLDDSVEGLALALDAVAVVVDVAAADYARAEALSSAHRAS
jgi:hypothetical protein